MINIQELPDVVIINILSYCDFFSSLNLKATSRFFYGKYKEIRKCNPEIHKIKDSVLIGSLDQKIYFYNVQNNYISEIYHDKNNYRIQKNYKFFARTYIDLYNNSTICDDILYLHNDHRLRRIDFKKCKTYKTVDNLYVKKIIKITENRIYFLTYFKSIKCYDLIHEKLIEIPKGECDKNIDGIYGYRIKNNLLYLFNGNIFLRSTPLNVNKSSVVNISNKIFEYNSSEIKDIIENKKYKIKMPPNAYIFGYDNYNKYIYFLHKLVGDIVVYDTVKKKYIVKIKNIENMIIKNNNMYLLKKTKFSSLNSYFYF